VEANKLADEAQARGTLLSVLVTNEHLAGLIRGHTDAAESVAFSPDGKTLASADFDGTIQVWDVATHRQLGDALSGHTGPVWSVAFSPDGKTLASANNDGTIRLWDVVSRQPLGDPLRGHTGLVWSVAFSPDGKTLASASSDRTIRLWDVSLESWIARACRIAGRNLSQDEWNQFVDPTRPYERTCAEFPPG
jgi:WD40 repeat protein